jgi:hypothetical protein
MSFVNEMIYLGAILLATSLLFIGCSVISKTNPTLGIIASICGGVFIISYTIKDNVGDIITAIKNKES